MHSMWRMPAAAEHEHVINIAFANMDWSNTRYTGRKQEQHLATWRSTTKEIIRKFNPAVICFCEVGEASISLEVKHVEALQDATCQAWMSVGVAATYVGFLYTDSYPYMTA